MSWPISDLPTRVASATHLAPLHRPPRGRCARYRAVGALALPILARLVDLIVQLVRAPRELLGLYLELVGQLLVVRLIHATRLPVRRLTKQC